MITDSDVAKNADAEPARVLAGCLAAVVALTPAVFWVEVEESFAIPKLVALVAAAAVCAVALVVVLTRPRSRGRLHPVDAIVGVLALLVAISFLESIDRDLSLWGERLQRQGLVPTLLYVAFYGFARIAITDWQRLGLIVRSAAAGATFVAGYAVMQRLGLDPIWTTLPQGRVFSTIGHPNALGAYLAMTIPLTIAAAVLERLPLHRRLWWVATAVQLAAAFFTLSRGAYLALAVALAVGIVPTVRARIRRPTSGAAVVLACAVSVTVIAVLVFVPTFSQTGERAIARTFSAEDAQTGSIRDHFDLWTVAVHITADHPALGTGPDTFPLAFDDYRDDVLDPDRARRFAPHRVESAHNIFLTTAAGSGVAAAIALAGAFFAGISIALRPTAGVADHPQRILVTATGSALLAFVIANSFITAEFAGSSTAWVLLGSAVAIRTRQPVDQS